MAANPSPQPAPYVQEHVYGGQRVRLREITGAWWIVPPASVQWAAVGPFEARELALEVAADFMSWGEAY